MEMTGSEAIVRSLEAAGVEYVFGLCGHANISLLDALEASTIKLIPVRNEQSAAHMADAYFRFSHKPGVVITTIGPGLANAVTGVWEAAMDSSGVIVIAGNVPSYMIGRGAFQELDIHRDASQADVFRPFVKRAWRVAHSKSIPFIMQRAFNISLEGNPGPVLIDVPMDFFSAVDDHSIVHPSLHRPTSRRVRGDHTEIRRAVELLINAERPLIHAGNGCSLSQSGLSLVSLAEHLAIPVTTSMQAQGIIDSLHPLSGGYPGAIGTPTGNELAKTSDVVLAIGTRFSELETSSWDPAYSFQFGSGSKLIQVDIDPHEIGRAYPVEVGIIGDARTVLDEALLVATELVAPRSADKSQHVQKLWSMKSAFEEEKQEVIASDSKPILVQRVIHELGQVIPEDFVLLADAGTFRHAVGQFLPIRKPYSWFLPSGLGTMGGTAAAALGAKLAKPQSTVVCLIGDGGFTANDNPVMTAVEWELPIVWIVLNNFAWDSIKTYQHIHFDDRVHGTALVDRRGVPSNPDFVMLARALGAEAARVEEASELRGAIQAAIASNVPYVVEVLVAPTKLRSTGNWDVGDILRKEGQYKRARSDIRQAAD